MPAPMKLGKAISMEKFKRKVLNKFLQIIRQGYYSVVSSDTSEYPQAQVTSNKKATLVTRLSTYGICANPPKDAHVEMFQSQGQESTKFGIFNDFLRRKKGLAEGECALYNTLTGAIVCMKADGSIAIESDTSIDGKAPVINIEADTEANVTAPTINANATTVNIIASSEVNVTAPEVNVVASVKAIIDSPAVELGDGALEKLVNKVGMLTYNGHDHQYQLPAVGAGLVATGAPNQLMVEGTDTTDKTKGS